MNQAPSVQGTKRLTDIQIRSNIGDSKVCGFVFRSQAGRAHAFLTVIGRRFVTIGQHTYPGHCTSCKHLCQVRNTVETGERSQAWRSLHNKTANIQPGQSAPLEGSSGPDWILPTIGMRICVYIYNIYTHIYIIMCKSSRGTSL